MTDISASQGPVARGSMARVGTATAVTALCGYAVIYLAARDLAPSGFSIFGVFWGAFGLVTGAANGLQTMDLVHVRDIARANILSAISPATDVVLNVGTGIETSLVDLAGHLTRIMGRDGTPLIHEAERAVNPVPRRLCDTSLAKELIGFEAKIGAAEGLADLVAWWQDESRSEHLRRAMA